MNKLIGFGKVAVINYGGHRYHYALYDDENKYGVGDVVLVSGRLEGSLLKIEKVLSQEESKQHFPKNITEEVIGKIDISAYESRLAKRKEAKELKQELDKMTIEMEEMHRYELYAAHNPKMQELLYQYKSLLT